MDEKNTPLNRVRGYCEQCQGQFSPTRPWQRFCSGSCRNLWHAEERRQALAAYRSNQARDKRDTLTGDGHA